MTTGAISAFAALLFACYTVKRVVSKNIEENPAWRTCKTIAIFLSTLSFSSIMVGSALFYKSFEYVLSDFSSLTNYGKTFVRLISQNAARK